MTDSRRRGQRDGLPFPYRQILERARHPSGWRSSLENRPNQSVRSFALEVLIAGAAFVIIVLLLIQLG
jgi:hypothetical protein